MMVDEFTGRKLAGFARLLFALSAIVVTCLSLNQLLNLHLFVGVVFIEQRYLYLLAAALLPLIFLVFPAYKTTSHTIAWYDWLLAALTFALLIWFAFQADRILSEGWEYSAPRIAKIFAGLLWLLILEGLRRTSGW